MHIRTFLKPLSFIPAILIMYMIFSFSSQPAEVSSNVSFKASRAIVKTADYVFDVGLEDWQIDEWAVRLNGVTRKLAHMSEYFLLAVAISFPLYVYGLHGFALVLVAGFFCIAFAAGDEYHQSFVSGRSPQLKDVGIDSAGVLIGIILVRIIGWTGRMTIFRPIKPREKKKAKAVAYQPSSVSETSSARETSPVREISRSEEDEYNTFDSAERFKESSDDYTDPAFLSSVSDQPSYQSDVSHEQRPMTKSQYDEPVYDDDPSYDEVSEFSDDPDDESSDELADDMPFFGFLAGHKHK